MLTELQVTIGHFILGCFIVTSVCSQLQGLRDALDQVTMEKSSILSQLTIQRDEMTSLTNQLAEQQQRMVTMTAAKDQMSTELYSCQQSLVSYGVVTFDWMLIVTQYNNQKCIDRKVCNVYPYMLCVTLLAMCYIICQYMLCLTLQVSISILYVTMGTSIGDDIQSAT